MIKTHAMTDQELDTFLAQLDSEKYDRIAQRAYRHMYKKRPVPKLLHLKAIVGAVLFVGVVSYVLALVERMLP